MFLSDGSRIFVGVKIALGLSMFESNPVAGLDQFYGRIFFGRRFAFELLDQPNVVLVFVAVSSHLTILGNRVH